MVVLLRLNLSLTKFKVKKLSLNYCRFVQKDPSTCFRCHPFTHTFWSQRANNSYHMNNGGEVPHQDPDMNFEKKAVRKHCSFESIQSRLSSSVKTSKLEKKIRLAGDTYGPTIFKQKVNGVITKISSRRKHITWLSEICRPAPTLFAVEME